MPLHTKYARALHITVCLLSSNANLPTTGSGCLAAHSSVSDVSNRDTPAVVRTEWAARGHLCAGRSKTKPCGGHSDYPRSDLAHYQVTLLHQHHRSRTASVRWHTRPATINYNTRVLVQWPVQVQ